MSSPPPSRLWDDTRLLRQTEFALEWVLQVHLASGKRDPIALLILFVKMFCPQVLLSKTWIDCLESKNSHVSFCGVCQNLSNGFYFLDPSDTVVTILCNTVMSHSHWMILIRITKTAQWISIKFDIGVVQSSRDSLVGIALGYGLDDRGSRVRFPAMAGNFSLNHRVQNGFGAHLASCLMDTRSSFPGGKAAGAWSWPLTSIWYRC
jgi:hypothetical protein